MGGYALQKCLRKAREAREAAEGVDNSEGPRKYEQPGTLVTLPSGLQYREIEVGTGPVVAELGSTVDMMYIVYRLSSGGYFKYSSGGTPVFLWSLGYGQLADGADDVGETYQCVLGAPNSLPAAVTPCIVGMRAGGKRRCVVPPQLGWLTNEIGPKPQSFGAQRRLESRRQEPLLFEAEVVRVSASSTSGAGQVDEMGPGLPFKLPVPPTTSGTNENRLPRG